MRRRERRGDHVAAFLNLFLGKFHDQDGVLGHQAHEHHQSDLEIDIVFQPAYPDTQVGADTGHGQRQDDGHRHRPAFVLRREEQEDEQEGQRQYQAGLPADMLFLVGKAAPLDADRRGQVLSDELFQYAHRLP